MFSYFGMRKEWEFRSDSAMYSDVLWSWLWRWCPQNFEVDVLKIMVVLREADRGRCGCRYRHRYRRPYRHWCFPKVFAQGSFRLSIFGLNPGACRGDRLSFPSFLASCCPQVGAASIGEPGTCSVVWSGLLTRRRRFKHQLPRFKWQIWRGKKDDHLINLLWRQMTRT